MVLVGVLCTGGDGCDIACCVAACTACATVCGVWPSMMEVLGKGLRRISLGKQTPRVEVETKDAGVNSARAYKQKKPDNVNKV